MRYILFFAALLVASCATITPENVLYKQYTAYSLEANEKNIRNTYSHYFSPNLLSGVNTISPDASRQLLFKDYMTRYFNHFEKINGRQGCLTISGYDSENMPLTFNIEYAMEDRKWLIVEIDILFVNSVSEFPKLAKCPREYLVNK